jgi:hypothetical protein
VGDAERYTPGSTIEKRVGTCISDGPGCFDIVSRAAWSSSYRVGRMASVTMREGLA